MIANASPAAASHPTRAFGRFELRQLLGKSTRTMVWLAFDTRRAAEVMLTLPRIQPVDAVALAHWLREARGGARLAHPNLAPVAEVGVQEHWPFIAVDRAHGVTLPEWLAAHPPARPVEVVGWVCAGVRGLAFAHEAGVAHGDPQLHHIVIDDRGGAMLMALGVAGDSDRAVQDAARARANQSTMPIDPAELRAQRTAASRDILACGVLLQRLLTGNPPLDQPDTSLVIARMAPLGRELVRLPWSTPLPIPEALRAIADRSTCGQERLRYQTTRSLHGALSGWLEAQADEGSGPLARLVDRLRSVGHLPALPGLAARVARVIAFESQRTDEIADQVLDDMALSFELLRTLNSALVQGTQVQGNGPVLTLRRIVSLIGVNGVRLAANTLREWPGPLSQPQATALQAALDRARLAGHIAQALRPRGYDSHVVYLIAVLQSLGRLMLHYHFADEAAQVRQLMASSPANAQTGAPEQSGLSEEAAAFAVLGTDIESLGTTVARHWGLDEDVMQMVRRLPHDAPVHKPESDGELLRLTASAANDLADAVGLLSGARASAGIHSVAQRYARVLNLDARDLADALQTARERLRRGTPLPAPRRGDTLPAPLDLLTPSPGGSATPLR